MAQCKSCGGKIIWAVTKNLRRIKLNAKTEKRFVLQRLNSSGGLLPMAMTENTYVSHFATCVKAAELKEAKK